jgi:hypothetical protein
VRCVDPLNHSRRRSRIEAPQGVGIHGLDIARTGNFSPGRNHDFTDGHGVRDGLDPQFGKETADNCTESDASCRLTSRGALQDGSSIVETVLLHADEVSVTGPRTCQSGSATGFRNVASDGFGIHHVNPFGPFRVADPQGNGPTHRQSVANTPRDVDVVCFEFHAGTATVTESATSEVVTDGLY